MSTGGVYARWLLLPILLLALTGCETAGLGESGSARASAAAEEADEENSAVLVADAVPPGAAIIGQLSATDCQKSAGAPAPTNDAALTQLKIEAESRGATLLTAVAYQALPADTTGTCYAAIEATGTAAKF